MRPSNTGSGRLIMEKRLSQKNSSWVSFDCNKDSFTVLFSTSFMTLNILCRLLAFPRPRHHSFRSSVLQFCKVSSVWIVLSAESSYLFRGLPAGHWPSNFPLSNRLLLTSICSKCFDYWRLLFRRIMGTVHYCMPSVDPYLYLSTTQTHWHSDRFNQFRWNFKFGQYFVQ